MFPPPKCRLTLDSLWNIVHFHIREVLKVSLWWPPKGVMSSQTSICSLMSCNCSQMDHDALGDISGYMTLGQKRSCLWSRPAFLIIFSMPLDRMHSCTPAFIPATSAHLLPAGWSTPESECPFPLSLVQSCFKCCQKGLNNSSLKIFTARLFTFGSSWRPNAVQTSVSVNQPQQWFYLEIRATLFLFCHCPGVCQWPWYSFENQS